jgi:hypothetical protein
VLKDFFGPRTDSYSSGVRRVGAFTCGLALAVLGVGCRSSRRERDATHDEPPAVHDAMAVLNTLKVSGLVVATAGAGFQPGMRAEQAVASAADRIAEATFHCGVAEVTGLEVRYRFRDCTGHFVRLQGTLHVRWHDEADGLHATVTTEQLTYGGTGGLGSPNGARSLVLEGDLAVHSIAVPRNEPRVVGYSGHIEARETDVHLEGSATYRVGLGLGVEADLTASRATRSYAVKAGYGENLETACPETGELHLDGGGTSLTIDMTPRLDGNLATLAWTSAGGGHGTIDASDGAAMIPLCTAASIGPH